jgi:hypothetical protein
MQLEKRTFLVKIERNNIPFTALLFPSLVFFKTNGGELPHQIYFKKEAALLNWSEQ